MADSESEVRRFRTRQPKTPDIREANPCGVCAIGRKAATDHEEPVAMDKGANRKDDSTHLPTLAPKTMAVGPERPCESQEEEGGDVRPRIANVTIRGRNRREPSEPIPENSAFGPLRSRETEKMDDGINESWHDASEGGWQKACEEVEDGAAVEKEEMRAGAEGRFGSRPKQGPNRMTF